MQKHVTTTRKYLPTYVKKTQITKQNSQCCKIHNTNLRKKSTMIHSALFLCHYPSNKVRVPFYVSVTPLPDSESLYLRLGHLCSFRRTRVQVYDGTMKFRPSTPLLTNHRTAEKFNVMSLHRGAFCQFPFR